MNCTSGKWSRSLGNVRSHATPDPARLRARHGAPPGPSRGRLRWRAGHVVLAPRDPLQLRPALGRLVAVGRQRDRTADPPEALRLRAIRHALSHFRSTPNPWHVGYGLYECKL